MNKLSESVSRSFLAPVAIGLLLPLGVAMYAGCKKDEPPPPLPSAAPANTPSAPLVLEAEDAGEDVSDAADGDASDAKKGTYAPASSLKACCAALAQNAASAPPPTSIYMMQAAAACNAAVAQGKDNASVIAVISGALKGAGMPGACH